MAPAPARGAGAQQSLEVPGRAALGSILSALKGKQPLVSPGRKQMPKFQVFVQEGLTQSNHCSDGGDPGACAPGFCAPKALEFSRLEWTFCILPGQS